MQIYNSLSHKKEEFIPNTPGKVSMYTCGPTVYHYAHIGNLRSYIMEDVLEKYLRYIGYPVKRVMNITDVGHLTSDADEGDDKMLKGAKREHKTVMEIAKFYTDAFFEDCRKLNIKRLVAAYGLPYDPQELSPIGESAVYYETVYRWPLTLVGAAAAVGLLLWGRYCRRREEET